MSSKCGGACGPTSRGCGREITARQPTSAHSAIAATSGQARWQVVWGMNEPDDDHSRVGKLGEPLCQPASASDRKELPTRTVPIIGKVPHRLCQLLHCGEKWVQATRRRQQKSARRILPISPGGPHSLLSFLYGTARTLATCEGEQMRKNAGSCLTSSGNTLIVKSWTFVPQTKRGSRSKCDLGRHFHWLKTSI